MSKLVVNIRINLPKEERARINYLVRVNIEGEGGVEGERRLLRRGT